ncbi:amidase signature enzyme, partial [Ophiobolus disseminans]
PISLDFDSIGPIAKSAEDIAVMMDVLVDPSKSADVPDGGYVSHLTKSFEGIRIGVLEPSGWHMPPFIVFPNEDADVQSMSAAYEKLGGLGVVVNKVNVADLDELTVDGMSQIQRVVGCQFRRTIEDYLQGLETSNVRTLDELMQFMRDNADKELPLESPNLTRLEIAAKFHITDEEYRETIDNMRDWGRRRAVDKCLAHYGVDVILGPGNSRINELSSAAGSSPEAVLPLSYMYFNGRPFGVAAVASANQEPLLIQLMSAWEQAFNKERKLPAWIKGDPEKIKSEL